MSDYSSVRIGKLKLKGMKDGHKKKTKKRKHEEAGEQDKGRDEDMASHGGWWRVTQLGDIRGSVAIELGDRTYLKALDNGLFTLGAPHPPGEGPSPEEILMAVPAGESRVAFKSGYGKYAGVDSRDRMVGRADAISGHEQWEPVFQDGKTALLGANGKFVSADGDDCIVVKSGAAGSAEMLSIRSGSEQLTSQQDNTDEDQGNLNKVELNYVKRFQKFQDKRIRLNEGGAGELLTARQQGNLHETLLDRRAKMKADRYCK